jgi:hypothetical protein
MSPNYSISLPSKFNSIPINSKNYLTCQILKKNYLNRSCWISNKTQIIYHYLKKSNIEQISNVHHNKISTLTNLISKF